MQDPASSHDDLSDLERQLAALAPIGGVDRDRLMFAAGRRAGGERAVLGEDVEGGCEPVDVGIRSDRELMVAGA